MIAWERGRHIGTFVEASNDEGCDVATFAHGHVNEGKGISCQYEIQMY